MNEETCGCEQWLDKVSLIMIKVTRDQTWVTIQVLRGAAPG